MRASVAFCVGVRPRGRRKCPPPPESTRDRQLQTDPEPTLATNPGRVHRLV